jgi:hypothetical protein
VKLHVEHPESLRFPAEGGKARAEETPGQCTRCEREEKLEPMKDNARSLQGQDGGKKGSGEQHERDRRSLQQYEDVATARVLRDASIVIPISHCAFTIPRFHDIPANPIQPDLTRTEGPSSVNGPSRLRPRAGGSTRTATRRCHIVNGAVQCILRFAYIIERLYFFQT